jgi:hypothetical protein
LSLPQWHTKGKQVKPEQLLVEGILSCVYNLFFIGRMELAMRESCFCV